MLSVLHISKKNTILRYSLDNLQIDDNEALYLLFFLHLNSKPFT